MKRNKLAVLSALLFTLPCMASIIHTNTESLVLSTSADGSYQDFDWNWAGYDSEAIVLTYDTSFPANTKASFRMRRPKDGVVYKEVLTAAITVSGTTISFSVTGGTNMVPVGAYWAEVITYNTSTSVYRSVAEGMINVNWSLFKDDAEYFEYYTNTHSLSASLIYYATTSFPGNVTFSGSGVYSDGTNFTFTGVGTGAVASVFARTGVVLAQESDYSSYYSLTNHTHTVANVTGLQAALDAKATIASFTNHTASTGTNVHGLKGMSIIDDAASDGSVYGRQDGVWTNIATSTGYVGTNDWATTNLVLQAQLDIMSTGKTDLADAVLTNAAFESRINSLETNAPMQRYSALASNVHVLASSTGVTAAVVGTVVSLTIPADVTVESAVVRWDGGDGNSFSLDMGTADMANSSLYDRWGVLFQAYREDTGGLIAGASAKLDTTNHDRVIVQGLPTTTTSHCRFGF